IPQIRSSARGGSQPAAVVAEAHAQDLGAVRQGMLLLTRSGIPDFHVAVGAGRSCAVGWTDIEESLEIFAGEPAAFHYKRQSGLKRSGIFSWRALRIRLCSASGRATRRSTNRWPSVVSSTMSPIWILRSSRRTTSGVMGRGLGDACGREGSGL